MGAAEQSGEQFQPGGQPSTGRQNILTISEHRELKEVEPGLPPGALSPIKREAGNPHDPLAIMIFDEAGHHLGYVPRVYFRLPSSTPPPLPATRPTP